MNSGQTNARPVDGFARGVDSGCAQRRTAHSRRRSHSPPPQPMSSACPCAAGKGRRCSSARTRAFEEMNPAEVHQDCEGAHWLSVTQFLPGAPAQTVILEARPMERKPGNLVDTAGPRRYFATLDQAIVFRAASEAAQAARSLSMRFSTSTSLGTGAPTVWLATQRVAPRGLRKVFGGIKRLSEQVSRFAGSAYSPRVAEPGARRPGVRHQLSDDENTVVTESGGGHTTCGLSRVEPSAL